MDTYELERDTVEALEAFDRWFSKYEKSWPLNPLDLARMRKLRRDYQAFMTEVEQLAEFVAAVEK